MGLSDPSWEGLTSFHKVWRIDHNCLPRKVKVQWLLAKVITSRLENAQKSHQCSTGTNWNGVFYPWSQLQHIAGAFTPVARVCVYGWLQYMKLLSSGIHYGQSIRTFFAGWWNMTPLRTRAICVWYFHNVALVMLFTERADRQLFSSRNENGNNIIVCFA